MTRADLLELLIEGRQVRIERSLGECLARPQRDRPQDACREGPARGEDALFPPLLGPRVEVAGELPLEGAAELPPVSPELAEGLLDLLRQKLGRQFLLLAGHRPLGAAKDPLGAAQGDKRRTRGDTGRLGRRPSNLGRDVDRRAARRLELLEVVGELRARRYDLRESGIRARAHSIVSFVMSMVCLGTKRSFRASTSIPRAAKSAAIRAGQAISPIVTPIAAPTRRPKAIAVRNESTSPSTTPIVSPVSRSKPGRQRPTMTKATSLTTTPAAPAARIRQSGITAPVE